jgi:hypothetical protein
MRNEMIGAIVRRAVEHPEFRQRLMDDPDEALRTHGFALEPAERAALEEIRSGVQEADDPERRLVAIAEDFGIRPPGA